MSHYRDDFSEKVKKILQERVANRCSNPSCQCLTSGPNFDEEKATRIGVAAHITAAASNGPRYDPALSTQQRKSIFNGIWLCQNCAKLIDSDEKSYSVTLIKNWKKTTESKIKLELEGVVKEDDDLDYEGWYCGHCNTFVLEGQLVCTGCNAEVAYEATKTEVASARTQGGIIGTFLGGILNFGIPNFLNSHFGLDLPNGWGLGIYSLLIIAVLAAVGAFTFEIIERKKFYNKPPRFFRHRSI